MMISDLKGVTGVKVAALPLRNASFDSELYVTDYQFLAHYQEELANFDKAVTLRGLLYTQE